MERKQMWKRAAIALIYIYNYIELEKVDGCKQWNSVRADQEVLSRTGLQNMIEIP